MRPGSFDRALPVWVFAGGSDDGIDVTLAERLVEQNLEAIGDMAGGNDSGAQHKV